MTKKSAYWQRTKLDTLTCYNEGSLRELLSFADVVRTINKWLASTDKIITTSSGFENMYLGESELHIKNWLSHPKKTTMYSTFNEYKRDILDDLDKCIRFGDENDLWEQEPQGS